MKIEHVAVRELCAVLLACLALAGCADDEAGIEYRQEKQPDVDELYHITDADKQTEAKAPMYIRLEEQPGVLKIEQPGDYVLSGSMEGQIVIDTQDQIAHLILDGVDVQSHEGPAIYVASAGKAVFTLSEGSCNVIADSPNYGDYKDKRACIFSVADLTFNGSGSLQVYGYEKHAIHSKDVVKALGGNIQVWSKGDGIRANDGAVIMPDALSVESEGNGIHTTKSKKENKGFIDVCGGDLSLIAGKSAFYAATDIYIRECRISSCQGILEDISCGGSRFIEEGCLLNE